MSQDKKFLRGAMEFISDKINDADLGATQTFNFEKGAVVQAETAEVKADQMTVKKMTSDTVVSGSSHVNVVKDSANATVGVGSIGGSIVHGSGNVTGQHNTTDQSNVQVTIQFGPLTDQVRTLRDVVDQHGQVPAQAENLKQIVALMEKGAAKPEEKSRLRELARDVCTGLHAYQPAVTLMNQVLSYVA